MSTLIPNQSEHKNLVMEIQYFNRWYLRYLVELAKRGRYIELAVAFEIPANEIESLTALNYEQLDKVADGIKMIFRPSTPLHRASKNIPLGLGMTY